MRYSCNQGEGSTRSPKYYSARRCKNQGWWKRGRHLGRKRMYCNIIHQVVTTGYAEGIPQACDPTGSSVLQPCSELAGLQPLFCNVLGL